MSKTLQTLLLEKQLYSTVIKRGVFGTFEVTLGWYGKERVDFMTYDCKDVFRCYEIKVSVADFHSSAKKSFVGNYNYYVMTNDLWEKVSDEIPADIGVYVSPADDSSYYDIDGRVYYRDLTLVKRPKRQDLGFDKDILYSSLIRCLHRDAEKYNRLSDDLQNIESVKKDYEAQIRQLDKNMRYEIQERTRLISDLQKIYGNDFVREFTRKRIEIYDK